MLKNDRLNTIKKQAPIEFINKVHNSDCSFVEHLAMNIDDYFINILTNPNAESVQLFNKMAFSIIALGGYGRKELCLYSDVDVLFLFHSDIPESAETLIKECIYPFWDAGFEVGYVCRSIADCIQLALEDISALTALLDSRCICGDQELFTLLKKQLSEEVIQKRSKLVLVKELIEASQKRHEHFGDATYLLEPNLKEGQGGLRCFHTMIWIAKVLSEIQQHRDLEYLGYVSHDEYIALNKAVSYLLKTRNLLHYLAKRHCDQLHFEYQTTIADILQIHVTNGQRPVEKFLGELHSHMEFIKHQHMMFIMEIKQRFIHPFKGKKYYTRIRGLSIHRNMLCFRSSEAIIQNPKLLLQLFIESADINIPLSAETKRLVKEFGHLISFVNMHERIKMVERILLIPNSTYTILKEMHNTKLLSKLIPEFSMITNRIQYNQYHIFPVDVHSIQVVQTLKSFMVTKQIHDKLYHDLTKEIRQPKLLLWAGLLHDIGKGMPDDQLGHSEIGAKIAEKILQRFDYKPHQIKTICFLISSHLLLAKTATRRDITSEETVLFCARQIQKSEHLKMLYLLTVADSQSTGPKAWNNWTAALLKDLFFKILNVLENGELASSRTVKRIELKKKLILDSTESTNRKDQLNAYFQIMSPRYFLYTPFRHILDHLALYESLQTLLFVMNVHRSKRSNTRTITLCAQDRPGIFSKFAGVFTLNNINILDARIYSWGNKIALDIFTVTPPLDRILENECWEKFKTKLDHVLHHNVDLTADVQQKMKDHMKTTINLHKFSTKVVIDNTGSSFFTIIEVFTNDLPGILFAITNILYKCNLDIKIAKIATNVDQVVDVFYVSNLEGSKIYDESLLQTIKTDIEQALSFTA
ncbi:MAG: [protein-PII] uridylyltransferase [Desulfobacterales bacterium]|nr:[protein-PII] uridylyltransferase [Desulfobacterales bacterium]